jgi:hypothetical protein
VSATDEQPWAVCRSCASDEVHVDPERCDFEDRPQILAVRCGACGKAMRFASREPDGLWWRAIVIRCPECHAATGAAQRADESIKQCECPACGATNATIEEDQ